MVESPLTITTRRMPPRDHESLGGIMLSRVGMYQTLVKKFSLAAISKVLYNIISLGDFTYERNVASF